MLLWPVLVLIYIDIMATVIIDSPPTDKDFRRNDLFTNQQYDKLTINGMLHKEDHDAVPCVYLLGKRNTYLISEICADRPGYAFGLYYELGKPTLGYINLESLYKYHENVDFLFNDNVYETNYRISVFKKVADELGRIVPSEELLEDIFDKYNIT